MVPLPQSNQSISSPPTLNVQFFQPKKNATKEIANSDEITGIVQEIMSDLTKQGEMDLGEIARRCGIADEKIILVMRDILGLDAEDPELEQKLVDIAVINQETGEFALEAFIFLFVVCNTDYSSITPEVKGEILAVVREGITVQHIAALKRSEWSSILDAIAVFESNHALEELPLPQKVSVLFSALDFTLEKRAPSRLLEVIKEAKIVQPTEKQ